MKLRSIALGALLGLYLGCGNSGDQNELGPETSCNEIIAACHPKDDASPGMISDCHTIGHDDVMSVCQENYFSCVEVCDAAPSVYDTDGMEESSGDDNDDVADDDDDDDGDSNDDGQTTDGGDTMGAEDTGGTTGGSTGEPGTTGGSSSGGDDAPEANCNELGSGCHDTPTPLGEMCHDVGHGTDEAACAEIWLECKEECGF